MALTIVGKKEPGTSVPVNLAKHQLLLTFPKLMFVCVCVFGCVIFCILVCVSCRSLLVICLVLLMTVLKSMLRDASS